MSKNFKLALFVVVLLTLGIFAGSFLSSGNNYTIKQIDGQTILLDQIRVISKIKRAYKSSVTICKDNGTVLGSGVVIRRDAGKQILIVTANHVVQGHLGSFLVVSTEDLFLRVADVVQTLPEADLALLEVVTTETEPGPYIKLAKSDPAKGEKIWAIGSPKGIERNITSGVISQILRSKSGMTYYRTDTDIFFGNSGGGVFDSNGDLIGIADAVEVMHPIIRVPIPGGGICVSLRHIKYLIYSYTGEMK